MRLMFCLPIVCLFIIKHKAKLEAMRQPCYFHQRIDYTKAQKQTLAHFLSESL